MKQTFIFPGLTSDAQLPLGNILSEALQKGIHIGLGFEHPDFSIFDTIKTSSEEVSQILQSLSVNLRKGNYLGNNISLQINEILNIGVAVMIDGAKNDLQNLGKNPTTIQILDIFQKLLSKLNTNSINGEQLFWLGSFFVNYKIILDGKKYEKKFQPNMNYKSVGNPTKSMKNIRKVIEILFQKSENLDDMNDFIQMGSDFISLGKMIFYLENQILVEQIRGSLIEGTIQ